LQEAAVARTPTPVISVQDGGDGTFVLSLSYADAPDGATSVLSFSV
jgi:hypothetical protein